MSGSEITRIIETKRGNVTITFIVGGVDEPMQKVPRADASTQAAVPRPSADVSPMQGEGRGVDVPQGEDHGAGVPVQGGEPVDAHSKVLKTCGTFKHFLSSTLLMKLM